MKNLKLKLSATALFFIGLTAAGILVYTQDPTKAQLLETQPLETQHLDAKTEYQQLQQIDNNVNEYKGKWHGLCRKNSITSINDFQQTINNDPILQEHFINLNQAQLEIKKTDRPLRAVVYHRSGDLLAPTNKAINIPTGDLFITDGVIKIRMQCCNDYIESPPTYSGPPIYDMPPIPPEVIIPPEFTPPEPSITNTFSPIKHAVMPNIISGHHNHTTAPVPEPSTILMFGAGLGILAFFGRKK